MTKAEQIEARLDCEARVQKAVEGVILEPCVAGEQTKKVRRALATGEQVRALVDDKGIVDDGDNLDRMSEDALALAFAPRDICAAPEVSP